MTAVRFAPSPGGRLDLGSARAAIINWLFARKADGRFLLRLDDIEQGCSREDFIRAYGEGLAWLGLGWDLFARQSERLALYAGAAERLKASGRLYPSTGSAAVHWRFRLSGAPIAWDDLIAGHVAFAAGQLGDPVVIRADGTPLTLLAAVVDDIELDISHVIRGDAAVAESAVQCEIFAALGVAPPCFAHFPGDAASGQAGGPRLDGVGLAELRDAGYEAMAVNSLLLKPGAADPLAPRLRLEELVLEFDLVKVAHAPPVFDRAALDELNAALLRLVPFSAVAHRLPAGAGGGFWEAVRPLLRRFADVETWWRICREPLAPRRNAEDVAFLARAAELLPAEPLDAGSWDKWLDRLNALSGRKGEAAIAPLRLALIGRDDGPNLAPLLPLIGRARAHARLIGKIA